MKTMHINKKTFLQRFEELLSHLRDSEPLMPKAQIRALEMNPLFNPILSPEPTDWWKESFDWYVAINIIPGGKYGPFYRVDGDRFWPQIGNPKEKYSEKKCFYGLEKPKNQRHAKELYNMQDSTPKSHVHTITIDPKEVNVSYSDRAYIFIGPVKDGTGYQMNPNLVMVDIIRSLIIKGRIPVELLNE